jgi:RNA polymerase sigma-70 factor (ECF subfamily)
VTAEATVATFEAMYASHVRDILAYCLRRTSHAEAHDATAEVFAVAWRRMTDMPADPETLPWLFGVAANVLKNQGRSSRRARNLTGKIGSQAVEFQPGPETQLVRRAEYEEVHRAIDSLKPKYRDVLKLVEWEELPREQVAEMLSVSRATIDQRIHRAYQQLERRLKHMSYTQSQEGGDHDAAAAS